MDVKEQEAKDDVSLLVLLVEANPIFWKHFSASAASEAGDPKALTFPQFFEQIIYFVNTFLLNHHMNHVAVIGMGLDECHLLYRSPLASSTLDEDDGAVLPPDAPPREQILARLKEINQDAHDVDGSESAKMTSRLSCGLSMALCYIQRMLRTSAAPGKPRILVISGAPDTPHEYIAVMNSIFSAQNNSIPVDSCIFGLQESSFLQQASFITGGIYFKVARVQGLLQYLLMIFAADLFSRKLLRLPSAGAIDFRASCFCHKRTIDIGFVCSVCLSIFCQSVATCSSCGTTFIAVT
eukprot:jgi/Mesvir1/25103/Mv21566-RA.1